MPSQYLSVESLELTPRNTYSALQVHEVSVGPHVNRPNSEDQHLLGNFRETSEQLTRLRKWLVFVLCMGVGMGVAGAALRFYSSSNSPAILRFGAANDLPFASVERKTLVKNSALWAPADSAAAAAPFPTGAWWSNLVVGEGDQVIAALPYQFKIDSADIDAWGGGLQISYGPLRRTSSSTALIDWYGVDLCLRASDPVAAHAVVRHDALTVDVAFDLEDASESVSASASKSAPAATTDVTPKRFTATLARGSPYATALYQGGATPVIASSRPLLFFHPVSSAEAETAGLDSTCVSAFQATYDNTCPVALGENRGLATVTWLLFFEGPNVKLSAGDDGSSLLVEPSSFTAGGAVRAALVPPLLHGGATSPTSGFPVDFLGGGNGEKGSSSSSGTSSSLSPDAIVLLKHAVAWPSGGDVEWDLNPPPPPSQISTAATLHGFAGSAQQDGFVKAFEGQTTSSSSSSSGNAAANSGAETELETATYSFVWQVRRIGDATSAGDGALPPPPLLALALPHQAQTLELASQNDLTSDQSTGCGDAGQPARLGSKALAYASLKGPLVSVFGCRWTFREVLTNINFQSPKPLPNGNKDNGNKGGNSGDSSDAPSAVDSSTSDSMMAALSTALHADMSSQWSGTNPDGLLIDPKWVDPYGFGKALARVARLALVAEQVGNTTLVAKALDQLEDALDPWLQGANSDALVYDSTWGGLISASGVENQDADFGNGWYNDHHFHYGYFLYAAAVVAKLDGGAGSNSNGYFAQGSSRLAALECILRDIANPGPQGFSVSTASTSGGGSGGVGSPSPLDDGPLAAFFPVARHKDFYDGHSWASGLFPMANGKSQESVSEAVNAYYSVHLLGVALGDHALSKWGRLLLALELRAAHWYWQMGAAWTPYPANFSASCMAGVVGSTDTKVWTWFGSNPEYVHGINLMPFTPITEELLRPVYVSEELPVLAPRIHADIADQWKGLIELARAVLDPRQAFQALLPLAQNRIDGFDAGNSLTNSLYWVATRPPVST